MAEERGCPECGERLSVDARQCACGWGSGGLRGKNRGKGPATPVVDWTHVCTWRSGNLRCEWPVGRFDQGTTRGFCLFHRAQEGGVEAAEIARDSKGHAPDQYLARAQRFAYGEPGVDNPNVAALRAQLKRHAGGERVGLFAQRVLGDERAPDEPGSAG